MPRVPKLPAGSLRLFGRVDRFTVECPRCAQLISAHFDRRMPIGHVRRAEATKARPSTRRNSKDLVYNPLTSRLCCPRCRRIWAVGLLLYPVHERSQGQQPDDTRPSWQQLLELRQLGGAFLANKPIRGRDSVNLYVEAPCTCERGRIAPDCPVHGDIIAPLDDATAPVGGEEEE